MSKPQVQILLSTYNGEKYLEAQLDSILAQTIEDWQVVMRDDGSTDGTMRIIQDYAARHPHRFIISTHGEGGNASLSFMSLLTESQSDYLMFCDQDDVWMPDKVASGLKEIQKLELMNPIALHFTDMMVVDGDLNELHPSFFAHQHLNPQWAQDPYAAFAQSMAAGCSMIFTRALAVRVNPIKAPLFQHDHWLLMHAAYFGVVGFDLSQRLLYRQHGANVLGAHSIDSAYFLSKLKTLGQVFARWRYIKEQFGSEISYWKLMQAKWHVNSQRLS